MVKASDSEAMPAVPSQLPSRTDVEQTAHVTCFAALPLTGEYEIVLEALRDVLESPPYFWEVARPDQRYFSNDVDDNVANWIARSHCYAVDLSEGNDDVMMELGQIYWSYPRRPLFLLQREGTDRRMNELLSGRPRIVYPWDERPNRERIVAALQDEIKKFEDLKKLHGKAHYLSVRALQTDWIPPKLAEVLGERYATVEELLGEDPDVVSEVVGPRLGRAGLIRDIQEHLRKLCDLPE
jgi:hypothetical protein